MEDIQEMFNLLRQSTDALLRECVDLSFKMRGGIQYESIWWCAPAERQAMYDYFERLQKEIERQQRQGHT